MRRNWFHTLFRYSAPRNRFRPRIEVVEERLCPALSFGPTVSWDAGPRPLAVAVGDFNGDNCQDLVTANYAGNDDVSVLLGNGSGGFAAPVNTPTGGSGPFAVAVGDFNKDGKQDLGVARQLSSTVSVLLGDGTGKFGSPLEFSVTLPWSVAVADFNGDGYADLAAGGENSSKVSVFLGNSGGVGAPKSFDSGQTSLHQVLAVGNFNGDEYADLAVTGTSGFVTLMLGDGTGNFGTTFPVAAAPGGGEYDLAVGDFNGDGKADLVVTGTSGVSVLLGDGTGQLGAPVAFPTGTGTPQSVVVGDFNADGRADIAAAALLFGSSGVRILLGNGSGGFADPVNLATGDMGFHQSLAVGDFNGDGRPDLAVASSATSKVGVLLNTTPNLPPVNQVPLAAQAVTKNQAFLFSQAFGNAITVVDPDAGVDLVEVTLTVQYGSLSLAGTTGLTFLVGDGKNDTTMTFRGTVSAVNAALNGLKYTPAKGYTGSDFLTITTSDLGSGFGVALTDTDNVELQVGGGSKKKK